MGQASRAIISRWDLSRFAESLRAAADQAQQTGAPASPFTARLLLRFLAGRA
jgi:hypothetical protein